jgi:hypothetical protein
MPKRCARVPTPADFQVRVRGTADEVARRAFELYERRCAIDGWDLDDWVDTDGELVQERKPPKRAL